jgi:WD40 repeat protein
MKKFLIIIIIALVLILAVFAVYNYFFKEEALPGEMTEENGILETGGVIETEKIKAISQEPAINPTIDGRKVKYHSANNGNIFQSDFDGSNLIRLSSNILTDIVKIIWSPNKNKVIGVFESNQTIKKYLYNFSDQRAILLNSNIRDVAWAPDREKIAYQYYDPQTEENSLNIAEPDGSQWQTIIKTRMKNLIVEWPDASKLAVRTRPSGLTQSVAYSVNLADKKMEKIFNETYGLTLLWSPLGDKVLFSETNSQGKKLKLKIADNKGKIIGETKLATLPEKCVWSQDNRVFFCAVPRIIAEKAVLPDDYYKGLLNLSDDFYKINLETGQVYLLTNESLNSYDAINLLLSPQEDYLLFVNKKDNLLYSLAL